MISRGTCVRVLGLLAAIGMMVFAFDLHMRPAHADHGPVFTYSDRIASTLEVGAEHEVTLSLATQPSSDLTITFVSMDPSVVVLSNGDSTPSERLSLVFTPSDWQAARAVSVTALAEGSTVIAQQIQFSNDDDRYKVWPIEVTANDCAAGQLTNCQLDVFGVAVYPIINGDLIGQPDKAELVIRWSSALEHASIKSFKLEWKYGSRGFASQTPKILDPDWSLLPFGSSQTVTSRRYRYMLADLPVVGVQYGIRITAVTDEGEGTPSEPVFATPSTTYPKGTGALEAAAILPAFIEREILAIHETDYPWLREAWDYLLAQNAKIIYWPTSDNSQVATACDAYARSATELLTCWTQYVAIGGGSHKPGGGRHFVDQVMYNITHELAHVYTLANNVSTTPGPIGLAHMYFQTQRLQSGRDMCQPEELFADMWAVATLGDRAMEFPYALYSSLCKTPDAWTETALAVVASALAGETPDWFSTRYGAADPDLELLWADITDLPEQPYQTVIIRQLQGMFGGYCDVRTTSAGAFASGNVRNPWRDGGCVPAAPSSLSATSTGNGSLALSWRAPQNDGGSPIQGYKVQWKSGSQEYDSSREVVITSTSDTHDTLTGLTNGQSYDVNVLAYNQHGDGASLETTTTPTLSDATGPQLLQSRVDGASLLLTWDESLHPGSTPPTSAFAVSVGESGRAVTQVALSENVVRLSLASAVNVGQAVTLSYNKPAGSQARPLRDVAGNDIASLSALTVRNDTTQTGISSTPSVRQTYIYRNGFGTEDTIELTVTFPEAVTVSGKPGLHIQIGRQLRRARYVGGSGTSSLVFRYTLVEGELDIDGISVPVADILMDSGTVRYTASQIVAPGQVSLADQANHLVDSVRPSLVSITAAEGGNTVRLTFDKALDEQSVPPPRYDNEFGYRVRPSDVYDPVEVTAVAINGTVVTLTLAAGISAADGLIVQHYQQLYRGQPPLRGALGNLAQPVWNIPIRFE